MNDRESAMELMAEIGMAQALGAAASHGVLEALTEPMTTEELSHALDMGPFAIRRILEVLVHTRWVDQQGGRWVISEQARNFNRHMPQSFDTVARSMAEFSSFLGSEARPRTGGAGSDYSESVGRLGEIFTDAARELAETLDGTLQRVLDLGTGSGVFGIAVARHHASSLLTGFDQPGVIESFTRRAAENLVDTRWEALEGDFLVDELPGGYDCTMICNVLRVLAAEDARSLVHRAMDTLSDEGQLIIVDVMGEDPPDKALMRSVYRLDLAIRTHTTGPHTDSMFTQWIAEAGGLLERRIRLRKAPLAEEALVVRR